MPAKAKAPASVNKSQEIREYKEKHPDHKPSVIMEAMAKKGVEVSPAFISMVISQQKARIEKENSVSVEPNSDIARLIEAEKFSKAVGGIEKAKESLALLEKMRS